jgi:hypothetical protein
MLTKESPAMSPVMLWERMRDVFSLVLTPLGTPGMRRRLIAGAMNFPLDSIVAEFRWVHGLAEAQAQALAQELRRYLAICAICAPARVPMEGPVDDLWQTLIGHRETYEQYCAAITGIMIVRCVEKEVSSRSRRLADARRFVRLYRRVFGERAPEACWPGVALLNHYRRGGKVNEMDFARYGPTSWGYADHEGNA